MKKLNFGCGNDIRKGWDNCDVQKDKRVIYCDANKFPLPFKDDTYDFVLLREVLPVVNEVDTVLHEIWRIVKHNGEIEIEVPYHNNKGAVNDVQVKHFFNEEVFKVFVAQPCVIDKKKRFEIVKLDLIPTNLGKLLPRAIRENFALFVGGLISKVHVKLRVVKRKG